MTHLEWAAFPSACLSYSPLVLFVTMLRAPLARIDSDFEYAGPGVNFLSHRSSNTTKRAAAYDSWATPLDVAQSAVAPLARGVGTVPRGVYVDNLYVRLFSGKCRPPRINRVSAVAERRKKYKSPELLEYEYFWKKGTLCKWQGGAWQGGCRLSDSPVVGRSDLDLALEVLRAFDVVLVLEWMHFEGYKRHVASLFGVQTLHFPAMRRHKKPATHSRPDFITAKLRRQDRFDLELYGQMLQTEALNIAVAGGTLSWQ